MVRVMPPSRVGGSRWMGRPMPVSVFSRPSSNRACGFPAHGFPSVVRRWACAARQEPELKIQETFGAYSRETRPSPLRHFASQHRHKCPPLAPRGLCSPTDPRYYGGLRLLQPPEGPRGISPLAPPVEPRFVSSSWPEISQLILWPLPDMPPALTPPQRWRELNCCSDASHAPVPSPPHRPSPES